MHGSCCSSKAFAAGALEVGSLHNVGQLNLLTDWLQTLSQSTNISSKLQVHHSLDHVASELQERLLAASFVCRDLYRSGRFSEGETPVVHRCAPSRLAKDYALDLKPGLYLVVLLLSSLDLCLLVYMITLIGWLKT